MWEISRERLESQPYAYCNLDRGVAAAVAMNSERFGRIERRLRHETRLGAVMWLSGVDEERVTQIDGTCLARRDRDRPIRGGVQLLGEFQVRQAGVSGRFQKPGHGVIDPNEPVAYERLYLHAIEGTHLLAHTSGAHSSVHTG
jgi:hypothetical protein